jgi:hypothetical protein
MGPPRLFKNALIRIEFISNRPCEFTFKRGSLCLIGDWPMYLHYDHVENRQRFKYRWAMYYKLESNSSSHSVDRSPSRQWLAANVLFSVKKTTMRQYFRFSEILRILAKISSKLSNQFRNSSKIHWKERKCCQNMYIHVNCPTNMFSR